MKYILAIVLLISSCVVLPADHYPMDQQDRFLNILLLYRLAAEQLHNAAQFRLNDQQPLPEDMHRQQRQQQKRNKKKWYGFGQQKYYNNNNKSTQKNCARMNVRIQQPRK